MWSTINIECSEFPEGKLLCIHRRPCMENKNYLISSGTRSAVLHAFSFPRALITESNGDFP